MKTLQMVQSVAAHLINQPKHGRCHSAAHRHPLSTLGCLNQIRVPNACLQSNFWVCTHPFQLNPTLLSWQSHLGLFSFMVEGEYHHGVLFPSLASRTSYRLASSPDTSKALKLLLDVRFKPRHSSISVLERKCYSIYIL